MRKVDQVAASVAEGEECGECVELFAAFGKGCEAEEDRRHRVDKMQRHKPREDLAAALHPPCIVQVCCRCHDKRRAEGLTTPKQIRCLEKYGFQHVGTWSFHAAKHMIDRIAASGWRGVPKGVDPKTYIPHAEADAVFEW